MKFALPSISQVMATRARATYSHRINFQSISYDKLDTMKEWCYDNCRDMWRHETTHAIYWQFADEQDAMMFTLRWGTAEGNKLK